MRSLNPSTLHTVFVVCLARDCIPRDRFFVRFRERWLAETRTKNQFWSRVIQSKRTKQRPLFPVLWVTSYLESLHTITHFIPWTTSWYRLLHTMKRFIPRVISYHVVHIIWTISYCQYGMVNSYRRKGHLHPLLLDWMWLNRKFKAFLFKPMFTSINAISWWFNFLNDYIVK